jgi:hypothetical protein
MLLEMACTYSGIAIRQFSTITYQGLAVSSLLGGWISTGH